MQLSHKLQLLRERTEDASEGSHQNTSNHLKGLDVDIEAKETDREKLT